MDAFSLMIPTILWTVLAANASATLYSLLLFFAERTRANAQYTAWWFFWTLFMYILYSSEPFFPLL